MTLLELLSRATGTRIVPRRGFPPRRQGSPARLEGPHRSGADHRRCATHDRSGRLPPVGLIGFLEINVLFVVDGVDEFEFCGRDVLENPEGVVPLGGAPILSRNVSRRRARSTGKIKWNASL
jgi:hypothetical protein